MSEFISTYKNDFQRTVFIACDGGRVCRPLVIVENGRSKLTHKHMLELDEGIRTFQDFVKDGLVEYLDVNEENDSNIAVRQTELDANTTHLEIEVLFLNKKKERENVRDILLTLTTAIYHPRCMRRHHPVPSPQPVSPQHLPSSAPIFANFIKDTSEQCAMGKQSIGTIAYNQHQRFDTLLYLMVYPQQPMVKTKTIELIQFDKIPAGQNAVVAVMSYSGYDIEDALVLNKASLDRGFGRCQVLRKYATVLKKYPNQTADEIRGKPSEKEMGELHLREAEKYAILDHDGIAYVGSEIKPGQIYINKVVRGKEK